MSIVGADRGHNPSQSYRGLIFREHQGDRSRIVIKMRLIYSEALTAQPGEYQAGYSERVIFEETVLGELIVCYVDYFETIKPNHPFVRAIASREQLKRSTGNWAVDQSGDKVKAANPVDE